MVKAGASHESTVWRRGVVGVWEAKQDTHQLGTVILDAKTVQTCIGRPWVVQGVSPSYEVERLIAGVVWLTKRD